LEWGSGRTDWISKCPMNGTATARDGSSETRLVVFMFTDLVDSTALARQLGDADYVRYVLEPHNRIFRSLLAEFPGATEIKHTGGRFHGRFRHGQRCGEFWPAPAPSSARRRLGAKRALHAHRNSLGRGGRVRRRE